jgi:hypothetical protein
MALQNRVEIAEAVAATSRMQLQQLQVGSKLAQVP